MINDDESLSQQERLAIHRRTLAQRLKQVALQGGEAYATIGVLSGIAEAREQINLLKTALRARGIAVDDQPDDLEPPAPAPPTPPPVSGGVTMNISGGQVGQVIGTQVSNSYYLPRPELPPDRNRQAMLQRVRATWVSGLLERALEQGGRIPLSLTELPNAVELALSDQVQELASAPRTYPPGTSIFELFAANSGALLILGAPGAGKTLLLLELARDLLDRADQDRYHPIPVVFNLSSWGQRQRPIADWMAEELQSKYDVPRKIARAWVADEILLPLFDGLDEVAAEQRAACVAALNQFRRAHGLVPLAVSCRYDDYRALPARLRLQGAVLVQPLTPAQIDAFLQQGGPRLAGLRDTLRNDSALHELARAPLMLAVLALTYENDGVELPSGEQSLRQRRKQLFDRYVERMFARRARETRYTPAQAQGWLAWLAQQMNERSQTIFYLESLQPDWLPAKLARWYHILVPLIIGSCVGLLVGATRKPDLGVLWGIGAALGCMLGADIAHSGTEHWPLRRRLRWAVLAGISAGLASSAFLMQAGTALASPSRIALIILLVAPVIALLTTIMMLLVFSPLRALATQVARDTGQQLAIGVFVGLGIGLSTALAIGLGTLSISPDCWLTQLSTMLYGGVGLGLGSGLLASHGGHIQVAERLRWSWRAGLPAGALIGLGIGMAFGWPQGLRSGLAFALVAGLTSAELKADARLRPNQGIWRSGRNALTGLAIAIGLALLLWGVLFRAEANQAQVAATVVFVALLWGFRGGLAAFVDHWLLRALLLGQRTTPQRYVRFLNDATGRTFMRRVGGGYIFLHRALQEHFAGQLITEQVGPEEAKPIGGASAGPVGSPTA